MMMRIALLGCSGDEADRVRQRLGDGCKPSSAEELTSQHADAAVIGSIGDRMACLDAVRRAGVPGVVLLTAEDDYAALPDDVAVLAPGDIAALPHLIRREIRISAEAKKASRCVALMQHTPGAVWTWSAGDGLVVLSDHVQDITGFSLDELSGGGVELWASRVHPADIATIFERWNELFARGEGSFEVEHRFLRKESQWVWLHEHVSLVREEGREAYVIGTTRDVTVSRYAEEALRKSELRYRTLVEQASDLIFAIDAEGRISSLNRVFEGITGWSREEWIGRPFIDALDPSSVPTALERLHTARTGGEPDYAEYRLRTRWGHSVVIEATAQGIEIDGQLLDTIGIARDITQRKESEERLAKEKRLASLGQLATSVAHEFNNVLMRIMPFAELLQRRFPGDERASTATRHIMQAVRHGREISQEVLRFARPGEAMIVPVVVSQWLEEFAPRAVTLLGPDYRLERAVADDDLTINADRALLDQVATNLIVNAREAMPQGGTLTIQAKRGPGNDTVHIEFRDTGGGIAESTIDHIFEPLFTTKRSGSGLGLSIAYQAMKQQDGTIQVESRVGAGSTFTLSFPAAAPTPIALAAAPLIDRKRKILIVEDDEAVGEGLSALLSDEGFDVRLVERGLEARPAVAEFGPDIVLLDVNLPDISGIEVYKQIRGMWPRLNVIFSTGHADAHALNDVQLGQAPSIMKPYDISELMAVIATLPAAT